jgi:hypothetical protein
VESPKTRFWEFWGNPRGLRGLVKKTHNKVLGNPRGSCSFPFLPSFLPSFVVSFFAPSDLLLLLLLLVVFSSLQSGGSSSYFSKVKKRASFVVVYGR